MSESEPHYFTYHRFWDFRALATSAGQYSGKGSDGGDAPDPVTDDEDEGLETVADDDASYLNGSAWNQDWGIQNWGKAATEEFPVRMQNSARNVYICECSSSFFFPSLVPFLFFSWSLAISRSPVRPLPSPEEEIEVMGYMKANT